MSLPISSSILQDQAQAASLDRRGFLQAAGAAAAVAAGGLPALAVGAENDKTAHSKPPETIVKLLHDSLSPKQKETICFDWEHNDERRGLLRTRVAANWRITRPGVNSEFYTDDQRRMIRDVFEGITAPDWRDRFDKQMKDDAGGFGEQQAIAIFGRPGKGDFVFVLTGRHMTLRCDGDSADHVAFGGPIFYGHAAQGFNEKPDHPGNVFWHQAVAANAVYKMLDDKQRKLALVEETPKESAVDFRRGQSETPGIPVAELTKDQREHVQSVLQKLIEPYRSSDRDEVVACLKAQGGLDKCHLAFYQQNDVGDDGVWDNWRLEGPAFVWHYRGAPHVHVWVNVADNPDVKLNA